MLFVLRVVLAAMKAGFRRVDSMSSLTSSRLRGVWRPTGHLNPELFCVLGVQPLPALELHGIATSDAADGSATEKTIENIESNVPPGSTHRDETAIKAGPKREARAAAKRFEFPAHIVVL